MRLNTNHLIWILIIAIFSLSFPLYSTSFMLTTGIAVLYLIYQSMAWNIIGGLGGQFSLGNTIFIGIGAYTSSYLYISYQISPWLGMLLGVLISVFAAAILWSLTLRLGLREFYFAMITLAFAEIAQVTVENIDLLGASYGLLIPVSTPSFFNYQFNDTSTYYYVILIMVALMCLICYGIQKSRFGFKLAGIRDNENAARAVGIRANLVLLKTFCLSAALSSIGGTFIAQYTLFIDPESIFSWKEAVYFMIPALVGGMRYWYGPIIGGLILGIAADILRLWFGSEINGLSQILFGIVVVLVMLNAREGVSGLLINFKTKQGKATG